MVALWVVLMGCAPSGVELSEMEVFIEIPQEGDALQRATVLADNLFSYPVRFSATNNGPAGDVDVYVIGGLTAIDAETSGDWTFAASAQGYLDVGHTETHTLTTKVYRCEAEDAEACRDEQGEENPLQTLTMQVTTEIIPTL